MRIDKVKQTLRKMNALVENMDENGQTSAIERDLLKRYLTELYEDVAGMNDIEALVKEQQHDTENDSPKAAATDIPEVTTPGRSDGTDVTSPAEDQTTYYDADAEAPKEQLSSEPVGASINHFSEGVKYYPPQEEVEEAIPEQAAESTPGREYAPEAPIAEVAVEDARFEQLFSAPDPADLAAKFATGRINSIDSAMGINQRLLTVNELFGGDMQAFNSAVAKLNGFETFEEAKEYLVEGPAASYGWDTEAKAAMAKDFVQIVRRRFL